MHHGAKRADGPQPYFCGNQVDYCQKAQVIPVQQHFVLFLAFFVKVIPSQKKQGHEPEHPKNSYRHAKYF